MNDDEILGDRVLLDRRVVAHNGMCEGHTCSLKGRDQQIAEKEKLLTSVKGNLFGILRECNGFKIQDTRPGLSKFLILFSVYLFELIEGNKLSWVSLNWYLINIDFVEIGALMGGVGSVP